MDGIKRFEPLWGTWTTTGLIGEGSFGKVYRAVSGEQTAAIKHICVPGNEKHDERENLRDTRSAVKKVRRELRLLNRLRTCENIVGCERWTVFYGSGGIGCDIFMRMSELTCIEEMLKTSGFTRSEIITLGVDICTALEACERERIIHLDVKPSNIFADRQGRYRLGDFGQAKKIRHFKGAETREGSYLYMAPEVFMGIKADGRADLYSLGIVLYRLLNGGSAPFVPVEGQENPDLDSHTALLRRMSGEPVPPPFYADRQLSEAVLKALEYKTKQRYQSASQMKSALLSLS